MSLFRSQQSGEGWTSFNNNYDNVIKFWCIYTSAIPKVCSTGPWTVSEFSTRRSGNIRKQILYCIKWIWINYDARYTLSFIPVTINRTLVSTFKNVSEQKLLCESSQFSIRRLYLHTQVELLTCCRVTQQTEWVELFLSYIYIRMSEKTCN